MTALDGVEGELYCALLAMVHSATVPRVFPFAPGLGITRRTFSLATTLSVMVQSVVVGAVAVLLAQVERTTGGWGTGMLLSGDGERSAVELFLANTTLFLVFAAIGVVSGAIFTLEPRPPSWCCSRPSSRCPPPRSSPASRSRSCSPAGRCWWPCCSD